jgi:hypothetical protein
VIITFASWTKLQVKAKSVSDYEHLNGSYHIDDEDSLLYVTKRVMSQKGYMFRYRAQITSGREQIEDSTPIHIANIERMTIATTLMTNKNTNASEESAGSQNDTDHRERDIIATGYLDPQPLKLQGGSGKSKKGDRRSKNFKQKKEMFVSQEKTYARSRLMQGHMASQTSPVRCTPREMITVATSLGVHRQLKAKKMLN